MIFSGIQLKSQVKSVLAQSKGKKVAVVVLMWATISAEFREDFIINCGNNLESLAIVTSVKMVYPSSKSWFICVPVSQKVDNSAETRSQRGRRLVGQKIIQCDKTYTDGPSEQWLIQTEVVTWINWAFVYDENDVPCNWWTDSYERVEWE